VSGHERAPLWALAYGALVAAILIATFGTAVVIRSTVLGIPGLEDAWSGLIMIGFLVGFVGALLWERGARRRRLAALALLAVWLIVGGIFARSSGDPWASLAAPVALGGFSVLLLALVVSLRSSDQDAAKPVTWQ
jgi:Na+/proline symporter